VAHQKESPLKELEPLLVDACIKMANIGMALKKEDVIELAMDFIEGTHVAEKLKKYKEKRKIVSTDGEKVIVGTSWYKNFLKRNTESLQRGRCKVKDVKRQSWCTFEHFENMYNGVYKAMVKAGIAVQMDEEVMYDENGDITTDKEKMVGRPSKFQLTNPDYLLFVDETGCNTNMKDDGFVGGEMFVLPVDGADMGVCGATTDMQFTVLAFTSGL
jgi:hypothetical protein